MLGPRLEVTLHRALATANARRHEYATLEHLLYALTEDRDAAAVLDGRGVDLGRLRSDLTGFMDSELAQLVMSESGDAKPTTAFSRVLQRAAASVMSSGGQEVTGADVLVAFFPERESAAVLFLRDQGMTRDDAAAQIAERGPAEDSDRPDRAAHAEEDDNAEISALWPDGVSEEAAEELQKSVDRAARLAEAQRHEYVTLEHLLLALTEDGYVSAVLDACGAKVQRLRRRLGNFIKKKFDNMVTDNTRGQPSEAVRRVLERALMHGRASYPRRVTGAHALVALFSEPESWAVSFLEKEGIDCASVAGVVRRELSGKRAARKLSDAVQIRKDEAELLSAELRQTLDNVLALAMARGHDFAHLEHLLLGLIEDPDALAVLEACRVDAGQLRDWLRDHLETEYRDLVGPEPVTAKPTAGLQRVIQRAAIHVQAAGRNTVTGANVLIALFSETESPAVSFLHEQDMTRLDAVNFVSHGIRKEPGNDA